MFCFSQIAVVTFVDCFKIWKSFIHTFFHQYFFSFRYLVYHFNTFERLGIPGPKPTFFLGNLLEIRKKVYTKTTKYKISKVNKRY